MLFLLAPSLWRGLMALWGEHVNFAMTQRFQFTLRTLLIAMLGAALFFGGIQIGREQQRRVDEAAAAIAAEEAAALALQKNLNRPTRFGMIRHQKVQGEVYSELVTLPDGSKWDRKWRRISPDDGVRSRQFHFDEPGDAGPFIGFPPQ